MQKTINSLIEENISQFSLADQQKMIEAGLIREALTALSIPGMPILEKDTSERDLNHLDLDCPIDSAYIEDVRDIISVTVFNFAKRDKLKSVAS